jgi:rubrerythrin
MNLGTFGAILSFGIDLENQAVDFYAQAAASTSTGLYSKLARGAKKRAKRLERTRRELVAEMILEPISGLEGDDYIVDLETDSDPDAVKKKALTLEESCLRFYTESAKKIPIKEVTRVFDRMAGENERNRTEIEDL